MVRRNQDPIFGMVLVVALVDGASTLILLVDPFADTGHILYSTCGHPSVLLAIKVLLAISYVRLPPLRRDPLLFRSEVIVIPHSSHLGVHTFAKYRRFFYGIIFLRAEKKSGF